jgi:hypothetical protein
MFTSYRNALAAVLIAIVAAYLLGSIFAATDASRSMDRQERQTLKTLERKQTKRYPAPVGCAVVGVYEDGTLMAYCVDSAIPYLSHGPDSTDAWGPYTGHVPTHMVKRGYRMDGQA